MDLKEELNEVAEADEEPTTSGWDREVSTDSLAPRCDTIGRRHKWAGGTVCLRCGASRESVTPTPSTNRVGRPRKASASNGLPQLFSMGWGISGMAISARSDRLTAVGNTMQVQAPMAGKRIDNVLQRTPIYKYLTSNTSGVVSDLVPLVLPPILVGIASNNPQAADAMRPLLVALMLPVMIESAKVQQQDKEMLQELNNITSEQLDQATNLINQLLAKDGDNSSDQ